MRVIGIDPGIGRMGWGVVEVQGQVCTALAFGCLETASTTTLGKRLESIHHFVAKLCQEYRPDAFAIEELFFNTNAKTAFVVGQARGVILLAASQEGVATTTYTPLQVKMAITGYGRAEKRQIGEMITTLLHLPSVPKPDDTCDALAIALTHAFSYKRNSL